jgi:arylsulfatase A-like enzyme
VQTDTFANQIDLPPTLYELAGVTPPAMQGASLAPLLRGETTSHRQEIFSEIAGPASTLFKRNKHIRNAQWRYTLRLEADSNELYDMVNDPLEMSNLAGTPEAAAVEQDLRQQIFAWMQATNDPEYDEYYTAFGW